MGEPQAGLDPHVMGGSFALIDEVAPTIHATVAHHWKRCVDAVCEQFEDAWSAGESPQVESYLNASAIPPARRAALLGELLKLERELREKRGEHPVASEYVGRFPGYPVVVRSVFGEDRIGDYDLIEPIGEGGMGVVYHARHRKIGRQVALKMIRQYCVEDSSAVDRFRLEAQLAARLEHENIVPVYEAGVVDGQHYYTMRYISGQSLSELIGKQPLPADRAAEIMEQVARAVDFAHTHDVLHRDIKPRNILLDASGRAYVTDFGLAKALGRPGTTATRTNDQLGTPPYMSPEQVRDPSRAGVASDVYSLGATLFECLTGKSPFQGDNPLEVYRQVLDVEPVRPRSLNPKCPRDLETICLKCLEKDPNQRYPSALAMAEDIRRFRDRVPILARRVGPIERVGKWSRKHPTAAALVIVSVTAAVLVAAVVQTRRTNAIIETSYEQARATVDSVTQFGERRLDHQPKLQKELLEIALKYYEAFLVQRGHDPEIAEDLADTFTRVARLNNELNSQSRALKAHESSLAIRRDLVKRAPKNRRLRTGLADTLHDIGILQQATGQRDASIASFREALAIRSELVEADFNCRQFLSGATQKLAPKDRALIGDLARSHGYIGDWERENGLKDETKRSYDRARELRALLAQSDPTDLVAQFQLARSENNSGVLFRELGKIDEAIASHQAAKQIQESVLEIGETEANDRLDNTFQASGKAPDLGYKDFRSDLANTWNYLGVVYEESNRTESAIECHLNARRLLDELVKQNPDVQVWDTELALTLTYLGELRRSAKDLEDAKVLLERLLSEDPKAPTLRAELARNYYAHALLPGTKETGTRQEWLRKAYEEQQALLKAQPHNFDFERDLARTTAAMKR